jgi:hypothetical protein
MDKDLAIRPSQGSLVRRWVGENLESFYVTAPAGLRFNRLTDFANRKSQNKGAEQ